MAKKKVKPEQKPAVDLLKNWTTLLKHIKGLSEEEALSYLQQEKTGKRRLGFLTRLYGHYNTLRTMRERAELSGV